MRPVMKDVFHVVVAIALILIVLGLITWSGFIQCRDIPGWCPVYYAIKGNPKTLIVFGETGLGNPDLLADALRDPNGAHATSISRQELAYVSGGNLKQFDLVIVTRAKKMSTSDLQAFMDYVDAGGRLVWTGDAGTELTKQDQFLYMDDIDTNESHEIISPWARKDTEKNEAVRFDQYLSLDYLGNWCQLNDCEITQQVGKMVPETGSDHKLIYGLATNLQLIGDFALVKDKGIGSTRVLSVDTQRNVLDLENNEIGKVFPLIVTSGVGEKIVYYAIPPEILYNEPTYYKLFVENLYNGLLR